MQPGTYLCSQPSPSTSWRRASVGVGGAISSQAIGACYVILLSGCLYICNAFCSDENRVVDGFTNNPSRKQPAGFQFIYIVSKSIRPTHANVASPPPVPARRPSRASPSAFEHSPVQPSSAPLSPQSGQYSPFSSSTTQTSVPDSAVGSPHKDGYYSLQDLKSGVPPGSYHATLLS